MDRFNGFSQDEINGVHLKTKRPNGVAETFKPAFRGKSIGIRRMPDNYTKAPETRPKVAPKKPQVKRSSSASSQKDFGGAKAKAKPEKAVSDKEDSVEEFDLERGMSSSVEEAFFNPNYDEDHHQKRKSKVEFLLPETSSILHLPTMDNDVSSTSSILPPANVAGSDFYVKPNALNVESPFKGVSLKDFEKNRLMIEEQNKQKKEMLYKAIEKHSQKTAAETRKIEEIKTELSKLDNDLAADVAILRKQIDIACIQFATIEKQYMKIEAQFLKSKIDLHNAAEKKELLTEHLCTVIAHNEDRKAQKLSDLMEKVGLTPSGDYEASTTQNSEE